MATNILDNEYMVGLGISLNSSNPAYQVDIAPGRCIDGGRTRELKVFSQITVDITASGANGLDTGSEAADTWYYVWIIFNASTHVTAGLISASSTSPTMPGGFIERRRVGCVRNDPSSNFLAFRLFGKGAERTYLCTNLVTDRVVLSNGSAVTPTAIDCSPCIPATSEQGIIDCDNLDAVRIARLYEDAAGPIYGQIATETRIEKRVPLDSSQQIFYDNNGAGGDFNVTVVGFVDSI